MPCRKCPGKDSQLVHDVRAIADDPRKGEFYKDLLPQMLTPRKATFILEVELLADFAEMEAMSHQVVMSDDTTLDALLEEAKDIIHELDSIETIIMENPEDLGAYLRDKWPLEVTINIHPFHDEPDE